MVTHFLLNGAYKFDINDDFKVEPSFLVKYASPAPIKADVGARVIYKEQVWLGGGYRHNDAFTALVGFMYKNYLILIPESNITKLEVQKQKDIIAPYSLSLFSLLKKVGASDYTASKYLMPKEIIMENKAKLTIRMPEKYISLDIDKISPEKVISLLKKTKFISLTEINIESPQLKSAL